MIKPGLPSLLLPSGLSIKPIKLPAEAYQPGLRAFVVQDHLRLAEKQLTSGQDELVKAKARFAFAEKSPKQTPTTTKPKELIRDDFASINKARWQIDAGDWKIQNGRLVQEKVGAHRGVLRLRDEAPTDFEARVKFATLGGETYRSVGIAFDVDKDSEAMIYLTPHAPARVQVSFKRNGKHEYPPDGAQQHAVPLNQTHDIVLRVRGNLLNVSVNGKAPLVYRLPIARRPGRLELITYDASARFEEFVLSTLPADVQMVDGGKVDGPVNEKQARALVRIAQEKVAHAEAMIAALKARAAADRAVAEDQTSDATKKLVRAAALAEKQQTYHQAQWNLARVDAGHAEVKLTPAQAKAAVDAARKAVENPGEIYTPLAGSLKTRENQSGERRQSHEAVPEGKHGPPGRAGAMDRRPQESADGPRRRQSHLDAALRQAARRHRLRLRPQGSRADASGIARLAGRRVDGQRWRMKHVHRLIVTSNAYRMSSSSLATAEKNLKDDPENRHYWRMNSQRMESQVVRDSLLHLAGELDLTLGGPAIETPMQEASQRRSLYFFHSAIEHNRFLSTFDEADLLDCYRRRDSIVPQQALALSNSKLAVNLADKIAVRMEKTVAPKDFACESFAWILGYAPTANEAAACEQALERWVELNKMRPDAQHRAQAQLIQALVEPQRLHHDTLATLRLAFADTAARLTVSRER